ncbi:MAG TPA: peptide deformylase [Candidatus Saccharimonadales bacterium]|nr:peptide deformylase [Candidatus Saccharimonadales bacterium]
MTKDDVITLPNPHLRERSKKVGIVTAEAEALIADMEAATLDWEASREHEVGVALAAVQVDRPLRIVVIRNDFDNKADKSFSVFINPVITKYEGAVTEDYEGCLSVPDIYGKVPRYEKVRIRALNRQGQEIRVTAEGFLARVFQHEIDHTNGIVFIDLIKSKPEAFFKLKDDGQLQKLDYETDVRDNSILW